MWAGLFLVLFMVAFSLAAPWIGPEGYDDQNLMQRLQPPSKDYPLGTDQLGRSVLTRLAWGGRVSLSVALSAMAIGLVGGVAVGSLSGFYGGWVDRILMGLMDMLLAFPSIILAIAIVAALGPGLTNAMIAVGIRGIPTFARLVRGQILSLKNQEFIQAARAVGAGSARILFRHLFPNLIAIVIVMASLDLAANILSLAALSFLGLGAQPPIPDWGGMLDQGRQYLRTAWWLGVFPGLAIMMVVLGFNLLGDGLRDILDPRQKR
ncbi:MAG: ABC transporter permease [Clostridiales bacterium]|nr:ABC transporter permease [Clostridiales bacterium]